MVRERKGRERKYTGGGGRGGKETGGVREERGGDHIYSGRTGS